MTNEVAVVDSARKDFQSFVRVSNRLALIADTKQLSTIVHKLLPKLLQHSANYHTKLLLLSKSATTSEEKVVVVVYKQIHSKLIEVFSHLLTRIRNDISIDVPCLDILTFLRTTSASNSIVTRDIALLFLKVGIPRCNEYPLTLVPLLLQILAESSSSDTEESSNSKNNPIFVSLAPLLVHCLQCIHLEYPKTTTASSNIELKRQHIAAIADLISTNHAVAMTLYTILLDVVVVVSQTTSAASNLPSPGMSMQSHTTFCCGTTNNNTTHDDDDATPTKPIVVVQKDLLLQYCIVPQRQYGLLNTNHKHYAIAVLVIACCCCNTTSTGSFGTTSPDQYLKQFLDIHEEKIAANDETDDDDLLSLELCIELLSLCLGVQSSWRPTTTKQTKRRPIEHCTPVLQFLTKIVPNASKNNQGQQLEFHSLMELVLKLCNTKIFPKGFTGMNISKQRGGLYVAAMQLLNSVVVRLVNDLSTTPTTNKTTSATDDNTTTNGKLQDYMGQCCAIACTLLAPVVLVSTSSSSRSSTNHEGSIAIRDECYTVLSTLARCSHYAIPSNSSLYTRGVTVTEQQVSSSSHCCIDTAILLFGCTSKEEEVLRSRAVAALDALLTAYCRQCSSTPKPAAVTDFPTNPWANLSSSTTTTIGDNADGNSSTTTTSNKNDGLARALLPLIWTAAQSYQAKSSRVAAARWSSAVLKLLDVSRACHILCFLAGDDVAAAAMAREGLGLSGGSDVAQQLGGGAVVQSNNSTTATLLPDFATFTEMIFAIENDDTRSSARLQRYDDFTLSGKTMTLRFVNGLMMQDLYGGDDKNVNGYLDAIIATLLSVFASSRGMSSAQKNTSIDLLEECSNCLLTVLSSSSMARNSIVRQTGIHTYDASSFTLHTISEMSIKVNSPRARRDLASSYGILISDKTLWTSPQASRDNAEQCSDSAWLQASSLINTLENCTKTLKTTIKSNSATTTSALAVLHGTSFLAATSVRSLRQRTTSDVSPGNDEAVIASAFEYSCAILSDLADGALHDEEAVGGACIDSLAIAFSYDGLDAPVLDSAFRECSQRSLVNLTKACNKFGTVDKLNVQRLLKIVKASGSVLAASTSESGSSTVGAARLGCVMAIFDLLGSPASRKDEEISIAIGEALVRYCDAYNPHAAIWSRGGENNNNNDETKWDEGFDETFANTLPPHEHVLYLCLRLLWPSSSPHKKTACAGALFAVVARGAFIVNCLTNQKERCLVQCIIHHIDEIQSVFISLLSYPKCKQFSRECSCLGLVACRGLLHETQSSKMTAEDLNLKLLRSFGHTTNFGGSALMESAEQAADRRAENARNSESTSEGAADDDGASNQPTSEVGGVSGMGEAALGAYREMAAASVSLGRYDVLYALLCMSVSHSFWSTKAARHIYSPFVLMGENSLTGSKENTSELREALRPHLGKLLPRILRACHDPNKQTRDQMQSLWNGLTGGGALGRALIVQYFSTILDSLLEQLSSKSWRARAGSCGALSEVVVGRTWSELGGGGAVLSDDDLYTQPSRHAGVRLLLLWNAAMRLIDDVHGSVRDNGETFARSVRALTIRLCNPKLQKTKDHQIISKEEYVEHERHATAAAGTTLRWLVRHGLNQSCAQAIGVCISALVEVVSVAKPGIIEPSLPVLLRSLLLAMSGLEPAALNYIQLRTNDQEALERVRLQLAQSGPLAEAVAKCLSMLPSVGASTQGQISAELDTALRQSVGFATRAAVADAVSAICTSCPAVFHFTSKGTANPSVRLLRALNFASERERGSGAKEKIVHAFGNLANLCPSSSVRSLALRACGTYRRNNGNLNDVDLRRSAASTLRAIAVRASDQFKDGGENDIWCTFVLPTAFVGMKDEDEKIAAIWKEVWTEGGHGASTSMKKLGTTLEEKLLPLLVGECTAALKDVSWSRRSAGAASLMDLCRIGALSPLARALEVKHVDDAIIAKAKQRAQSCNSAIVHCVEVLARPRLWKGKLDVLKAVALLASKWSGLQCTSQLEYQVTYGSDSLKSCPWLPILAAPGEYTDDLFVNDNWFSIPEKVDSDDCLENESSTEEQGSSKKSKTESIDFSSCDAMDLEGSEHAQQDSTPPMVDCNESRHVLTVTGLCRLIFDQAVHKPANDISDDLLPYRACAFKSLAEILNSLQCSAQKREIFGYIAQMLIPLFEVEDQSIEKRTAPVIVAGSLGCLKACLWEGYGSNEVYPVQDLLSLLEAAGGKQQAAWSVRQAAASCIGRLAVQCSYKEICQHVTIIKLVNCAMYAVSDTKFWRVRVAGYEIIQSLVQRANKNVGGASDSLLLEAVLPQKESIEAFLSVTDSEAKVNEIITSIRKDMISWP